MPTYEYICDACKAEFERVQRFADDPIRECPVCGQPKARRRISAAGIVFKGSGWYVHDSKRKAAGKPAAAAASKDADGGKAAGTDGGSGGAESAAAQPSDSAPAKPEPTAPSGAAAAPSGTTSGTPSGGATSGTSSPTGRSAP